MRNVIEGLIEGGHVLVIETFTKNVIDMAKIVSVRKFDEDPTDTLDADVVTLSNSIGVKNQLIFIGTAPRVQEGWRVLYEDPFSESEEERCFSTRSVTKAYEIQPFEFVYT